MDVDSEKEEEKVEPIIKARRDNRSYKYLKLDNGLKCLLIQDPGTEMSAASIDVHVGCGLDPKPLYGTAHFLEHMLF